MMQMKARKSRKNRVRPMRRACLNVENLEDRQLLTGPSGVVMVTNLVSLSGLIKPSNTLTLMGDAGNNSIKIAPSPTAGFIRISGVAFTSINGAGFAEFPLASVANINIQLFNGKETLMVSGFNIPGNFNVVAGGGADTFMFTGFGSNQLTISSGDGNNTVTLNGVKNGLTSITTGNGDDTISITASTIGTATIVTQAGNDTTSVTGSTVGMLQILQGTNASGMPLPSNAARETVTVTGNTLGKATIKAFGRRNATLSTAITVSNNTLTSNVANSFGNFGSSTQTAPVSSLPSNTAGTALASNGDVPLGGFPISSPPTLDVTAGAVTDSLTPSSTSYRIILDNDVFNTNSPAVLYNGSLRLSVGNAVIGNTSTAVSASTVQVSRISGVNDVTVSVGNNFNTCNGPASTIKLDTITARSINYSVGTNSTDVELTNSTVAGPVLITLNDGWNNLLVNNVLVSLTPTDLILGRLADLTILLGDNSGVMNTATLTNLNIGRDLTLANGNGDTMFTIANDVIGQDFFITDGASLFGIPAANIPVSPSMAYFGGAYTKTDSGQETYMFMNVKVLDALIAVLDGGLKQVSAMNLVAGFGEITTTTGTPNSNTYWDQGGNQGYFVNLFDNFLTGPPV